MHGLVTLTIAFVLASAAVLPAQPIPAGLKVGLAMYLQAGYGGLKNDLLEAAKAMPDDDYGFKPGTAPEMRTFGQVVAHVAEGQFGTCGAMRGVENPAEGRKLERELTTKAELVKALSDSFEFCDEVFETLTDENALQFVKVGQGEVARSAVIAGILAHDSEMYGIATVYMRAKDLVPPSTARQTRK